MADYLTFKNLQTEVHRVIRDYNEAMNNLVKMTINMVYLNEIMSQDKANPLYWMVDMDDSLKAQGPATITAISKANPGVFTTSAAHGLAVGDIVTVHAIVGMTELNERVYAVSAVPTSTTLSLGVTTSSYTTYESGGTIHHRGKTLQTSGKQIQRIVEAGWHDEEKMVPVGPTGIEDNPNLYHWTDRTSRPEKYYFGKSFTGTGSETNQLIWHPGADQGYTLRYWFEARAPKLVNNNDVPLLPPQFHHMIIAGTAARLSENNIQVDNPTIWPAIYANQLSALEAMNQDFWEKANKEDLGVPYLL